MPDRNAVNDFEKKNTMADVIQLLPDAIANQIAAGEVVQRPASVVKELMENALDAGASTVKVIVKDAGKTLIQVIDDGCGMSETDVRMAFERHATSKIRKAEDLFTIGTLGFRGEALPSIAAVSQVEVRTRQPFLELGTRLVIEDSKVKTQEPCQAVPGTNIAVKNLFYNLPARRKFLKSETAEFRRITEEFLRLAIAYPDVHFSLHHNQTEIRHLPPANLRQRIVAILGSHHNKKIVPVKEETDVVKISGFVGKPEFARKSRGDQYFFVNRRFVKDNYLNHAVRKAYEELIPEHAYPLYVLFIELDPAQVDVNVHPTKQEIKFEDERLIYQYLRVAIRHALGRNAAMPTLDFEQEPSFTRQYTPSTPGNRREPGKGDFGPSSAPGSAGGRQDWEKLYRELDAPAETPAPSQGTLTIESSWSGGQEEDDPQALSHATAQKPPYQVHQNYIISPIKSGFLLIDQKAAHERILYEHFLSVLSEHSAGTQQQLFPHHVQLAHSDADLLRSLLADINKAGFDIEAFGQNSFVVKGVPAEMAGKADEVELLETLLEQYKIHEELDLPIRQTLARSLARSAAVSKSQQLSQMEMQSLIDRLFACEMPYQSPSGRRCFLTFELDELAKRFSA